MKDKLGGRLLNKLVVWGQKIYSYFRNDINEDKKAKGTQKRVIKRNLKFENYIKCLESTQLDNKLNYLEKK